MCACMCVCVCVARTGRRKRLLTPGGPTLSQGGGGMNGAGHGLTTEREHSTAGAGSVVTTTLSGRQVKRPKHLTDNEPDFPAVRPCCRVPLVPKAPPTTHTNTHTHISLLCDGPYELYALSPCVPKVRPYVSCECARDSLVVLPHLSEGALCVLTERRGAVSSMCAARGAICAVCVCVCVCVS